MTRQQVIQTLRQSNISQANINALMTGRVPRMTISPQSQTGTVRQVRAMQGSSCGLDRAWRRLSIMQAS